MRHIRAAMLATGLSAVLVLAGCGDHATRRADPRPTASTSADQCLGNCTDPIARGPFTIRGAEQGGTVRVLTHDGLTGSLDPAAASEPDVVSLLSGLVTRSLTQWHYDPRTRSMVIWPDLATDLGRHNDDYTKWQFTLRNGARFEDGRRVTARDVAWGIERCMDARTFPTGICQDYAPWFLDGSTYGGPYTRPHEPFRSVRAHGHRITFRFSRPTPDLPYLTAFPAFGPVPLGSASRPAAYARHPLATGPYRIQSHHRDHGLVLVRNPRWDPRTDPSRTAYPDRYVVHAGLSARHIDRLLLADDGSAQTSLTYDTVRTGPYEQSPAARRRLVLGADTCTTYWAPDDRAINDPRVRRALADAFPYRAAIGAEGLEADVTANPANHLLPPKVIVHHDAFRTDPAGARRLLARAHALGRVIRFTYDPTRSAAVRLKKAIVVSLRASGFTPRPEEARSGPSQTPGGPPPDVRLVTWCGRWNTGSASLPEILGSGRDGNVEHFSRPAVDRWIGRILKLPLEQQSPAWKGLDRQVVRRWQPVVPLWYGGVAMAHGSRIEGMADDAVHGMPTWGRIWVSGTS